ncbi:MAG: DUF4349 domain-containing protein [Solirubrobacteraceae bacterium]|nr:DUF4349 domain-containing protein [Solirubrobacteraceae bacterium]
MFRREAPLHPDAVRDLDALDAVLGGDHDADPTLALLASDVDAARPRMDDAARERLETRMQAAILADRGVPAEESDAAAAGPRVDRTSGPDDGAGHDDAADHDAPGHDGPARGASDGPRSGVWMPRVASGGGGGRRPLRERLLGGGGAWRPALVTVALAAIAVPVAISVSDGGGSGATSDVAALSTGGDAPTSTPESFDAGGADDAGGATADAERPRSVDRTSADVAPEVGRGAGASAGASVVAPGPSPTTTTDAPPTLGGDRQVVRDVTQTVRVGSDEIGDATNRITRVVQDAGGYLGSSQVQERGDSPSARFEIVVPTDRLDETVGRLSRIGELVRLDRRSEDVTSRAASLEDQIADLRAERDALRRRLARTTNDDRREARRRELRLLTNRIAGLQAQQRSLRGRTQTSRIELAVVTGENETALPAPDDDAWGVDDALDDAGRVLEVLGGAAIVAGVVIVPLGGLLLVGWLVVRRRRRRIADELVDEA